MRFLQEKYLPGTAGKNLEFVFRGAFKRCLKLFGIDDGEAGSMTRPNSFTISVMACGKIGLTTLKDLQNSFDVVFILTDRLSTIHT